MDQTIEVKVSYNGVVKTIKANVNQATQAVFQHAVNEFGVQTSEANLMLAGADGQPFDLQKSVKDNGIVAGAHLQLLPRRVGGGA